MYIYMYKYVYTYMHIISIYCYTYFIPIYRQGRRPAGPGMDVDGQPGPAGRPAGGPAGIWV